MESGKPVRVTRKDAVSFAQVAELNWNEVKDPYSKMRKLCLLGAVLLALVTGGLVWWFSTDHDTKPKSHANTEKPIAMPGVPSVSSDPEKPVARLKKSPGKKSVAPKGKSKSTPKSPNDKKDEKGGKGQIIIERDKNDKTPIVY